MWGHCFTKEILGSVINQLICLAKPQRYDLLKRVLILLICSGDRHDPHNDNNDNESELYSVLS